MRRSFVVAMLFLAATLGAGELRDEVLGEIPFRFRDGLLWVEVVSPHSEKPLSFLLDSGASVSVLDLETTRRLGLKRGRRVRALGVGTQTTAYWPQSFQASASGVSLPGRYLALDLKDLSAVCGRPVDGLIGADFFRSRLVRIDFETSRIQILTSVATAANVDIIPLAVRRDVLCVPVAVGATKPRWVRLDTGCASALQWVAGRNWRMDARAERSIGIAPLLIPSTTTAVHLGERCFDSVEVGLHRREIFRGEAGLLGNGLLSRYGSVTADAKDGRLLLEPRKNL